jgi:hypothetical protein
MQYKGLIFKTHLEAQWAAFFDLAGWDWWVNPAPIGDWCPDFMVSFRCGHSECSDRHTLLISVLPVSTLLSFSGHPALSYRYAVKNPSGKWVADAGAAFGKNPLISQWEMSHGAGGGIFDVSFWVHRAEELWTTAGSMIYHS